MSCLRSGVSSEGKARMTWSTGRWAKHASSSAVVPSTGTSRTRAPGCGGVAREGSHHPEAELAMALNGVHHPLAEAPRPDQENGLEVVATPADGGEDASEGEPRRRDQHQRVAQEKGQGRPRIALAEKVGEGHQHQCRGDAGLEDFEDFLEVRPGAVGGVEVSLAKRQRQQHQRQAQRHQGVSPGRLRPMVGPGKPRQVGEPEGQCQHHHVGGYFDGRVEALESAEHRASACAL